MARIDELRLMTKVARLYYEERLRQVDIMDQLGLSQTSISRLLKRARQEGIVRINVSIPPGVHAELEDGLQRMYGLKEAVVTDSGDGNEDRLLHDIGRAAAFYVETALRREEVVGISSWSRALLAMMDGMPPMPQAAQSEVVQILGGIGNPEADVRASRLTMSFAETIRATPKLLPAPGVVRTAENRRYFLQDTFVQEAMAMFPRLTLAVVGIGAVGQSSAESSSGVVFSDSELAVPRKRGAVGDICLRFFDSEGKPVVTNLDNWVIGIQLNQLQAVRRTVAVAGGRKKIAAIRGAMKGKWINGLITDRFTAELLLKAGA